MLQHSYSGEGIVLGRRNYGEADRILSVFTKNNGRISLIAKGVRRLKSKKRGHIEIFSHIKFQAINGHSLDIMTEAEIIDDFKKTRLSLNKISLAYYFIEVVGKITHEGESNPELFNFLLGSFKILDSTHYLKDLRLDFVLRLLTLMGYWPENKKMDNVDAELEHVLERQINSERVGRRVLTQ